MIYKVWSDLTGFRSAIFRDGMNVVLADQAADSDENESTNGLGKTTLLRIIQFCLGGDFARNKVLTHPELHGVTFGIDLGIGPSRCTVSRNTASPDFVKVPKGFADNDLVADTPTVDITLENYRRALSRHFLDRVGDAGLSFRDLSYYFIRIGKDAYIDPQAGFRNQSGPSKRNATSYMLELNWQAQQELHDLLKSRTNVQSAISALSDAGDADNERTIGDLDAERVVLEGALRERQVDVRNFNVRDDYHDLERRLKTVDQNLHSLINQNHSDSRLLQYYEASSGDGPLFDANKPVSILEDAGAIFKPEAIRSLAEVAAFHQQIHINRRDFLVSEIQRLKRRISERNQFIQSETNEKSSVLRVLASSGALETLIELQRDVTALSAQLEALRARIDERKRFDRRKDALSVEIAGKRALLKRDLDDRQEGIDEAIALFAEYTSTLYGVPGKLSIDVKDSGYRFTFTIDRQGSDGVDQMVVFCFDLVVATLRARHGAKFKTLIHDSTLFADVDPRQYGLALQLATKVCMKEGFQYVCCLNAGALPVGHLGDLKVEDLVRLRLTDQGESGRLLGRRLSPR